MTFHDEQRRRLDEPRLDEPVVERRMPPDSGMSWGLPLGIAAVVLVLGLIFFNFSSERTTTASYPGGTTQSTSSAPAPSAPATPPAAPKEPTK
jgi:hypothetical protein